LQSIKNLSFLPHGIPIFIPILGRKQELTVLSDRINKIHSSPTLKVSAEAKKMKSEGINVIDLSLGEPDFPTPDNVKKAAIKAINENKTHYTPNAGIPELRRAIAEKFKQDNNLHYSPNEIIVSNGAKQSIFNAIQTLVSLDEEVIIPAPYWVSYPEMVSLAHGKSVIINAKEENNFKITPAELQAAITEKTKLLILCNPSNPTGAFYSKQELQGLEEILRDNSLFILSDEIYEKLLYDDNVFTSFAALSKEMKARTITVNGVSKSFAMTGWRIGFTAGPEPVIKGIDKIQGHSTSNASSISQYATLEALTGPQSDLEKMHLEFAKRRELIYNGIKNIPGFRCNKPEGAFYLFPNISSFFGKSSSTLTIKNSFDFAMFLLFESKIAVVPGSAFGAEGYIRISYAASEKQLLEAIERIKSAVINLR
jgi:aspartate/methionine/tyrosine aminotransferase